MMSSPSSRQNNLISIYYPHLHTIITHTKSSHTFIPFSPYQIMSHMHIIFAYTKSSHNSIPLLFIAIISKIHSIVTHTKSSQKSIPLLFIPNYFISQNHCFSYEDLSHSHTIVTIDFGVQFCTPKSSHTHIELFLISNLLIPTQLSI